MTDKLSTLLATCGQLLIQKHHVLVTAESCTGGGIAYFLTSLPGSSAWFDSAFVTYSNLAKHRQLGVSQQILQEQGAVSKAAALAMAAGALKNSGASVSVAVTGIAGPSGGSLDKPVGTVWIAWATQASKLAKCFHFSGDRQAIRLATIHAALEGVIHLIDSPQ